MADGGKRPGFIAFLVVLLVPPAVAGGFGQQFVTHHPVWAVVIGLAYEAAAAIAGYFALITRDLLERWRPLIVNRLDLFLRRQGPRFERRYRQSVLASLQNIDQKGLVSVGSFTPALESVFVDVSLVPRPPHEIQSVVLPELAGTSAKRQSLGELLSRPDPMVLAVVGAPGSGKTTLLRHAARQACVKPRARRDRRDQVRDFPVLLYLRDHAATITANGKVSVAELLRGTPMAGFADEPPGWLEQKLQSGQCLVLLDGLDEVAMKEDRVKVAAWAERQVQAYRGNHFVISSRPLGYQSARVTGAEIVQVCGFTADQVARFVHGWYHEVERHRAAIDALAGGTPVSQDAGTRADQKADALLRLLQQAPAIYDLTVSPLLLTMIANVHEYRGTLPCGRADLYSEICEVVLWRRQEGKGLDQQLAGVKKKAILADLAYTMMQRRVSDLGRADVIDAIRPALRRAAPGLTPEDFLTQAESDGLLTEREPDLYAFAHKTFQEYLAATHIREKGLVTVLTDAVNDDWWAEATLFYAARSDADPIIRACIDAGTIPAFALASECLDQGSDLDPNLGARFRGVLASVKDPDDPAERRLLAGVLLTRHLRQRTRTSTGSQVCVHPVPSSIYRLFLADTQMPLPDANPAILQQPDSIAVGIRRSDATAFLAWANAVIGGQPTYRLAVAAELDDLTQQQRIPALPSGNRPEIWVDSELARPGSPPLLGLFRDVPDRDGPHRIPLTDALAYDLANSGPLLSALLRLRAWTLLQLPPFIAIRRNHILSLLLDSALASSRDLAHALAPGLARDLAYARTLARGRDLARTLDSARFRAVEIAAAYDLDSAHARARDIIDSAADFDCDLAHALDRHLVLASRLDLDSRLGLDSVAGVARDLARALARDLAPGIDLGLDLDDPRVGGFARAFARTFALAPGVDLARALALDRAPALAGELASDLASHSAHAPSAARDLHSVLSLSTEQGFPGSPDQLDIDKVTRFTIGLTIGRAFSVALLPPRDRTDPQADFFENFKAAFIAAVGAEKDEPLPSPDELPDILRGAVDTLLIMGSGDGRVSRSWPATVAERLLRNANPVFTRDERPTREKTTAIRLAALCLACEADGAGREDIGSMFRQVAVGITWLMGRASGELPAAEAIMLAVE